MSRCIPLAALSLCTFAGPLACASGPASGTPSSPRSGSSASVSSGAEAEPPGDHACRAIINVDGAFFDVHMFGDGREARAQRGEGNLMVVDDRVFSVQAMTFGKRLATSQVSLQELPRGLTHEFLSYGVFGASPADLFDYCAADLDNPDGGGPTSECYAGHEMEGSLAPIAFLGPYLSLSGGAFGYTGGAHGIDEAQLGVWNIGANGAKQAAAVALDDLLTQQQLDLAKLAIDGYEIDGFGYDEAETFAYEPGLEDVTGWSLSLNDAGALELELSIGCCSWALNHGHFEVLTGLEKAPPLLQSYVPHPESKRWERAECGSIDIEGVARDATGKVVGGSEGEGPVLGVYWLDAKHPFVMSWIPKPEALDHGAPPDTHGEAPGEVGRRMMKAKDFHAAAALFEVAHDADPDGPWLGEWGWAEFKLGNYEQAEVLSSEALRHVTERRAFGPLLYNLGRIAEATGQAQEAVALYERSLSTRENATVQKRLEGLRSVPGGG